MIVFLLEGVHEENDLLGVFSTEEKAQEYFDKYQETPCEEGSYKTEYYTCLIKEHEVDG